MRRVRARLTGGAVAVLLTLAVASPVGAATPRSRQPLPPPPKAYVLVDVDTGAVIDQQARIVILDSLNGYLNAMPNERFLIVHLHELLTYLGRHGVATLLIGANIILESVMSYFGFGIQPPDASWGSLVSDGQGFFDVAPWLVIVPGLLIFFTVLSFNLVGDGLRDALDPYMTER